MSNASSSVPPPHILLSRVGLRVQYVVRGSGNAFCSAPAERWARTGDWGKARVLRVCFTAVDLLHVTVAAEPAPLIELMLAAAALHRTEPVFSGWRQRTLPRAVGP